MVEGRPTKLTKEAIEKAEAYLEEYKDENSEFHSAVPIVEGMALFIGVNKTTLYEWDKKKNKLGKKFSNVFSKLKMRQAVQLIDGGLTGKFSTPISKMMLSKHDYIEETKVENKLTGDVVFTNGVPRPQRDGDSSQGS